VTINVHAINAPRPEITATPATNCPAHALWGTSFERRHEGRTGIHERVVTNETHDDGRDENVQCRTRHGADDRRPKDIRTWSFTRLAVMAAASTPMNEKSATPAAIPMPL